MQSLDHGNAREVAPSFTWQSMGYLPKGYRLFWGRGCVSFFYVFPTRPGIVQGAQLGMTCLVSPWLVFPKKRYLATTRFDSLRFWTINLTFLRLLVLSSYRISTLFLPSFPFLSCSLDEGTFSFNKYLLSPFQVLELMLNRYLASVYLYLIKSQRQIFGCSRKKMALLVCQAKGDTAASYPKTVVPSWEDLAKCFMAVVPGQGCW